MVLEEGKAAGHAGDMGFETLEVLLRMARGAREVLSCSWHACLMSAHSAEKCTGRYDTMVGSMVSILCSCRGRSMTISTFG